MTHVLRTIKLIGIKLIGSAISENKPESVHEFLLTSNSAKRIINDLANNYTARVKFGKHARERMQQRRVTNMQVLQVLGNRHSRVTEGPHQTPAGDWKCNLQGMAAGDIIEVVVTLKRHESDPSAFIVTVMVK